MALLLSGQAGYLLTGRTSTVPMRAPGTRAAIADRLVEILGIDQKVAGDLLARFYERPVGDERFAVAHSNDGRGRRRLQRRCADILPSA